MEAKEKVASSASPGRRWTSPNGRKMKKPVMSIQVTRFAFVCHFVSDIGRAREFYERVLGLRAAIAYEGAPGKWWIEYDLGGETLAIKNFGGTPGGSGALPALEVADVDSAHAAINAAGVKISEPLGAFPRCRHFAIQDPDGNEIILHQCKAAAEVPLFDPSVAKEVAAYLHALTGRTVGHRQAGADGKTHLFSPSGIFVATEENSP
jgi:predicted enzyme related to lactoylglutathione lyase